MIEKVFDADPELLAGFIDDSLDDLDTLYSLFVTLETESDNLDVINTIFRPVHSIKGNSAFFGLIKVKKLAHEMETLLDLARKEQLVLDQSIVTVLLAGVDMLKEMLTHTREGQNELNDVEKFNELVEKVISAKNDDDVFGCLTELYTRLEKLKKESSGLETLHTEELNAIISMVAQLAKDKGSDEDNPPRNQKALPTQIKTIMSLVEEPAGDKVSDPDSEEIYKCLNQLKELTDNPEAHKIIDSGLDEYDTMVNAVGFDPLLSELLAERMKTLMPLDGWKVPSAHASEKPPPQTAKMQAQQKQAGRPKSKPVEKSQKTMRVAEDSIDNFLSYVGDLIVVGEMYNHLQKKISLTNEDHHLNTEFRRVNETFDNLSFDLQKSIMEIRKVPIKVLLQKVPRMIRDIAAAGGKDITVELSGEDIKVDKRLIETLDAPLTHMTRNAADHGIEMPDARLAAGKPKKGTVSVAVTETDDDVLLTITDDGKGLDYEAIKAKAVKLDLIQTQHELTQDQIADLLFISGVSTAKKVTDVSGRGVGMDVVRRNITDANGQITISSQTGKGSTFVIQLPKAVSTQIIDGYLVRLVDNNYVISMDVVREVFRPDAKNISTVTNKGECVLRHGKLLPVVRLFGTHPADANGSDQTMVALEAGKEQIALYVDDVLGIHRVVLKEPKGLESNSEIFSAAAVMGDGSVAMVLNVDCLIKECVK